MDLQRMLINTNTSEDDSFDVSREETPSGDREKDIIVIEDSSACNSDDNKDTNLSTTIVTAAAAAAAAVVPAAVPAAVPLAVVAPVSTTVSKKSWAFSNTSVPSKRPPTTIIDSDSDVLGTPSSKRAKNTPPLPGINAKVTPVSADGTNASVPVIKNSKPSALSISSNIAEQLALNRKKPVIKRSKSSTPPFGSVLVGNSLTVPKIEKSVSAVPVTTKTTVKQPVINPTNSTKKKPTPKATKKSQEPKVITAKAKMGESSLSIPLNNSTVSIIKQSPLPTSNPSKPQILKKSILQPQQLIKPATPKKTISNTNSVKVLNSAIKTVNNATTATTTAAATTATKTPGKNNKTATAAIPPSTSKKASHLQLKDPVEKIEPPKVCIVGARNSDLVQPTASKKSHNGIVVVDIPLYNSEENDYLDENGQVIFNYASIINEYNIKNKIPVKKNLLNDLENNEEGDDLDGEEMDDDMEDEADGGDDIEMELEDPKESSDPSKKQHPSKGKSRIGKYDIEDPFIDDTELLWENQRAATKDGFFVFFGPLIEKGHYASFERIDGTMKKGGIRSTK